MLPFILELEKSSGIFSWNIVGRWFIQNHLSHSPRPPNSFPIVTARTTSWLVRLVFGNKKFSIFWSSLGILLATRKIAVYFLVSVFLICKHESPKNSNKIIQRLVKKNWPTTSIFFVQKKGPLHPWSAKHGEANHAEHICGTLCGCISASRGTLFGSVGNGMVCCRAALLANTRYMFLAF